MNSRRLSLAVVVFFALGVTAALAQPQVTVVLTNGQRYSGTLAYQNNTIALTTDNGGRMTWPIRNVAVIEYEPGQPSSQELSAVQSAPSGIPSFLRGALVDVALRNGQVLQGRLTNISADGTQVSLVTTNGTNTYSANDMARLYLNPSAAQTLYASAAPQTYSPAVATTGTASSLSSGPVTISVPANQPWTATGITVQRGQMVHFGAPGEITWGPSRRANANGANVGQDARQHYPVPSQGVGALLGKVGADGTPFMIGANGWMRMPADGELYLGINDDYFQDNRGSYSVTVEGQNDTVGTSGQTIQPKTVSVPGNQAWTPTGITVTQGQTLSFNASGQVGWAQGASNVTGPDGNNSATNAQYPVPNKGVGALIGRVGPNGQPFAIGSQGRVTMPASGELFLGVNDNYLTDNRGSFTVQISSGQ